MNATLNSLIGVAVGVGPDGTEAVTVTDGVRERSVSSSSPSPPHAATSSAPMTSKASQALRPTFLIDMARTRLLH
jgi:hypothetical protein